MAEHPSEVSRRRFYRSPRARRRAVVGLVVAFIFVSVMTGLFYQTTQSGLAPESGVVKLAGLTAPVKVIRDAAGIPHIYAQNRLDLARALLRAMDSDLDVEFGPARQVNGVTRRLADTSAATRDLGFTAQVGLDDGLRRLVAWWTAEKALPEGAFA